MNPMKPEELREALKGICIISITPFKEDGAFDYDGYAKNLNYLLAHGLNKSNPPSLWVEVPVNAVQ